MKKIISLLLALTLVIAFSACGNDDNFNETENTELVTEIAESAEFSLGETEGNIYKNAYLGLGFEKDEDWVYYDEEQMRSINNIALDMAGEDTKALIEAADVLYDMQVVNESQSENVNVCLEKVDENILKDLDIVANNEAIVPVIESSYKEMGVNDFKYEHTVVEIDGESFPGLKMHFSLSGIEMYQIMFQKKCAGHLATMTVTTCIDDTTADLVDNFFVIK